MRSLPFWDITHRQVVSLYRRFGTKNLSHLLGSRNPSSVANVRHVKCKNILTIDLRKIAACLFVS
jgi:hypothetical protein